MIIKRTRKIIEEIDIGEPETVRYYIEQGRLYHKCDFCLKPFDPKEKIIVAFQSPGNFYYFHILCATEAGIKDEEIDGLEEPRKRG